MKSNSEPKERDRAGSQLPIELNIPLVALSYSNHEEKTSQLPILQSFPWFITPELHGGSSAGLCRTVEHAEEVVGPFRLAVFGAETSKNGRT